MPPTTDDQVQVANGELQNAPVRSAQQAFGSLLKALAAHHIHLHSAFVDAVGPYPMIDIGRISPDQAHMITEALGGERV